jgi:hypothetical protein
MEKGMGMGRMGLRLLVALGLVLCILTGWKTALGTLVLLRSPDAPLPTTVARAPEHRWVVLTDAVLDCATQQVRQRTALVLADDASGEHLFVAQLASPDGCAVTRRLDGVFVARFSRDFLRERQKLDLPPGPARPIDQRLEIARVRCDPGADGGERKTSIAHGALQIGFHAGSPLMPMFRRKRAPGLIRGGLQARHRGTRPLRSTPRRLGIFTATP